MYDYNLIGGNIDYEGSGSVSRFLQTSGNCSHYSLDFGSEDRLGKIYNLFRKSEKSFVLQNVLNRSEIFNKKSYQENSEEKLKIDLKKFLEKALNESSSHRKRDAEENNDLEVNLKRYLSFIDENYDLLSRKNIELPNSINGVSVIDLARVHKMSNLENNFNKNRNEIDRSMMPFPQ